jgi:hypothetical protein
VVNPAFGFLDSLLVFFVVVNFTPSSPCVFTLAQQDRPKTATVTVFVVSLLH